MKDCRIMKGGSIAHSLRSRRQRGASMVEFVIVTPLLMFMGLGVMQFGLIYHAKSMLNYATFEAARNGAVNNGQTDIMRKELGYRMAPVFGGSGTLGYGAGAMVRSVVIAQDPTATKIEILNPTPASYQLHGERKDVVDRHGDGRNVLAIPNSHLRYRNAADIKEDGLNVHDANLLKIRVTYGYQMRLPFLDMEVPGLRWTMRTFMMKNDPDNWMYYIRGMIPLTSTATVRMQSEAWDGQLDPIAVRMFDSLYNWTLETIDEVINGPGDDEENSEENNEDEDNNPQGECDATTGLDPNESIAQETHDEHSCPIVENPDNDNPSCTTPDQPTG